MYQNNKWEEDEYISTKRAECFTISSYDWLYIKQSILMQLWRLIYLTPAFRQQSQTLQCFKSHHFPTGGASPAVLLKIAHAKQYVASGQTL